MGGKSNVRLAVMLAGRASEARSARRAAFLRRGLREPLVMLMLWTLTAGLGLTLACVGVSGLVGHPYEGWHVPARKMRETRPRTYESVYVIGQGMQVNRP